MNKKSYMYETTGKQSKHACKPGDGGCCKEYKTRGDPSYRGNRTLSPVSPTLTFLH